MNVNNNGIQKMTNQKELKKMTNQELEKYYYPIYWIIKNNDIEITDRYGAIIPKSCKIHKIEKNFIYEQIQNKLQFSGEIISI